MLDGNACAARCWEGRARQRLNIEVKIHTRRIHVSLLLLTVFLNKPCLAKATQGARLVYIIDTFVVARHRRENKCLRGASWPYSLQYMQYVREGISQISVRRWFRTAPQSHPRSLPMRWMQAILMKASAEATLASSSLLHLPD